MADDKEISSAIEYFVKADLTPEKFAEEFKRKNYKLREFLKVFNAEFKSKGRIDWDKQGDMLLNFTAVFTNKVDEFYDNLQGFKQSLQKKCFPDKSESEEHVDEEKINEKSNFKSDISSPDACLERGPVASFERPIEKVDPLDVPDEGLTDNSDVDGIFPRESVDRNDGNKNVQKDEEDSSIEIREWEEYLIPHLEILTASTPVDMNAVKEDVLNNLPPGDKTASITSVIQNSPEHKTCDKFMALLTLITEGKVTAKIPEDEGGLHLIGRKV